MEKDDNQNNQEEPLSPGEQRRVEMRQSVRHFYDLQKLRIQAGNRTGTETVTLSEEHKKSITIQSFLIDELEKQALVNIKRLLKEWKIYEEWIKQQKGIGPTLSGVLLAEIDISRCETPSALWAYCGLAVKDGKAARRTKGEKCGFNPWLKSKVLKVLGECMIKSKSNYRKHYDDYKTRKENQLVDECMACDGSGKVSKAEEDDGDKKGKKVKKTCANCGGTGGPAPWGCSKMHRHNAAMRKMIKMFLLDLYKVWREMEGLEVVPPYSEAVLGRHHGDHAGMGAQLQ